jgi:hypothetical protein
LQELDRGQASCGDVSPNVRVQSKLALLVFKYAIGFQTRPGPKPVNAPQSLPFGRVDLLKRVNPKPMGKKRREVCPHVASVDRCFV